MMTVVWCDVETTGIDPTNSAAFEIAILVYQDKEIDGKMSHVLVGEKEFHLNPLNDQILFHEGAYKVHGVSEETIRSYPSAEIVMKEIADWLIQWSYNGMNDHADADNKFVFAGYNCGFDYGHVKALFDRCGIDMNFFFSGRLIDVFDVVKQLAPQLKIKTKNQKLETMTKALGIEHADAHGAMSDIKATRRLYEVLWLKSRNKK
ncbi:MAG: 3'-5' exonuclease [Treponema sp.]|nr:3'-5' exonuclease [Treponema sp.]